MKNEQEIIEHAMTMLQAHRDGKKLSFTYLQSVGNPKKAAVKDFEMLLRVLGNRAEVTIAPEPKEHWAVVDKNGNQTVFTDEEEAKAACERWDLEFPRSAPHTIEHYAQVMP